jgi:hypothetical protein
MNQRFQHVEQSQTHTERTIQCIREWRSETRDPFPALKLITTGAGLRLHAIKPPVTRGEIKIDLRVSAYKIALLIISVCIFPFELPP